MRSQNQGTEDRHRLVLKIILFNKTEKVALFDGYLFGANNKYAINNHS